MLTPIAIVAFPKVSAKDREWMEDLRATHDPQVRLIALHITLLFPCSAPADLVAARMSEVSASTAPIEFWIRRAQAMTDAIGPDSHVFLLPDAAASAAITTLHDRLYDTDVLKVHMRADLPFLPHLTVAAMPDFDRCRELADTWQARATRVRGRLDEIALVDIGTSPVATLARCRLSQVAGGI